ncbi:MAG: competence protein ComEC [Patescibacteria group bacterium]|nr:competence protein ComEC [Patescibacteria group bacterium]
MRDTIIFTSIFSFLVGVFVRSFLPVTTVYFWVFGVISFLALLCFLFFRQKKILLVVISIFFVFVGVFRFDYKDSREPKNVLDDLVETEVSFTGVVSKEPDRRENNQRLVVRFENLNVLVTTELYPEFLYGDKVFVSGKLQKPKNFKTDIGKEFDYVNYLSKDSIYYSISFAEVSFIDSGYGNSFISFLLKTKSNFLKTIESIIPPPQSSLLGGLLLGTKQSLGEDLQQNFIDTGLVHIVVLSGYNVTIVAEAIMRFLSFLPMTFSIAVGSFSIIFFAIMTGAGATIVRASVMAILALLARGSGNAFNISRALAVAGFLMVLHNPYILYFDLSFQLSFLATIGLIYLSPLFIKYFMWLPKKAGLQEIASATIATQIFVLPFILYKMGTLSIIAPVTNLIVLPFIPATMFFGFLTGIVGLLSPTLAMPFGFISNLLLKFEIFIVETFSKPSFAAVEVRSFSIFLVLVVYLFIFWVLYKHYKIESNGQRK